MRERRCGIWEGRMVEEDWVRGCPESGLESLSVSMSSLGSHSSSSAIASFKRLWYVSSFSIASVGRPEDATLAISSQVSQSCPVAARVSRSLSFALLLRSSCGMVFKSAESARIARDSRVRMCWWRKAEYVAGGQSSRAVMRAGMHDVDKEVSM